MARREAEQPADPNEKPNTAGMDQNQKSVFDDMQKDDGTRADKYKVGETGDVQMQE